MIDVRCPRCKGLLFRSSGPPAATIEIRCHKCKLIITWPSMAAEIKAETDALADGRRKP